MKEVKVLEGMLNAQGLRFGIVVSRFNEFFTSKLLGGALDALHRHGASEDDITVAWVPGAFELPLVSKKMAESGKYDAIIALGTVIRGSTTHYDYVCNEAAKGIAQASMATGVPVAFSGVTTENLDQAIERSGTKAGNKGADGAMTAIEMANLLRQI